jgi:hypothetical protein
MLKSSTWEIEAPWQNSEFARTVNSFDKAFGDYSDPVSASRQNRVFRFCTNDEIFYIKQYFSAPGPGAWLGYSRCQVEVRNIKWFDQQGIACGRLVAHGIEKENFQTRRGVLVTANVKNSMDLETTAEKSPLFRKTSWRRNIIKQLAEITRRLHSKNFCHNDFQWRNILVTQEDVSPQIFLIDCPFGRQFSWPILNYRKIKDLGSLDEQAAKHLSRTDRLRFYKHYQGITRLRKSDKKNIRTMLSRYSR